MAEPICLAWRSANAYKPCAAERGTAGTEGQDRGSWPWDFEGGELARACPVVAATGARLQAVLARLELLPEAAEALRWGLRLAWGTHDIPSASL